MRVHLSFRDFQASHHSFRGLESRLNHVSEATETVIPSQSRIVAAKERRERLRAGPAEQDYISLTITKRADIPQGPHPESRLMREEDEIGEGEDGR